MADLNNMLWEETPVDVTAESNFIWGIANKLRGSYMPDKYGDVVLPMVVIRRFECTLQPTKQAVVDMFKKNPTYPYKAMCRISGFQFYNTSEFDLKELCNDEEHISANFKSYISGFSKNVQDILTELEMTKHIDKMAKDGCLYSVVKAFSELDLDPSTYDSIKMGYIFENLIGRFYQNVDAGQFYTGRDIIKLCVSLLIAEGCEDIFDDKKILTVCDQACGTGGMLSTAFSYLKHYNPTSDVRLFGQELMGPSYAVGLAEMLIKGQNAENFLHTDTLKTDAFSEIKMRFLLENPPFGTPWSGEDAKQGQEEAVKEEYAKGLNGRWGAGLPGGGDSQLLFMQSAIDKMDDKVGRGAIISNGSPLFTGGTASGESQIRRWLLENDLVEAIVQMPTDLFYNTGIATYIWILSKNKRAERKGKIQLIDASAICHKLRKPLGNKKNEFSPNDRAEITKLYADFKENELVKIFPNTEFIYKEYAVMQPLQRSYSITEESIQAMLQKGALGGLYDEAKVYELEEKGTTISGKEEKKLEAYRNNKPVYDAILARLRESVSDKKYLSLDAFTPVLKALLNDITTDAKLLAKITDGLSVMDKEAEIQRETKGKNKGEIIYDKETKDTEIVRWDEDIDDYMAREVLPYVPDAKWFWEEDLSKKKPVIKIGAEIPFTRYFYDYQEHISSDVLAEKFMELEKSISIRISNMFEKNNINAEMKDSGIEWIGKIPVEWDLIKISGLYSLRNTKVSDKDYPPLSVTMKGILPQLETAAKTNDHDNRKLVKKGDFAINSRSDRRGSCGVSDYDGSVSLINTVLKPNRKIVNGYYNWLFHTVGFADEFYKWGHGIVDDLWTTTWQDMKRMSVPLPLANKQKQIANYLNDKCAEIDLAIEEKKKQYLAKRFPVRNYHEVHVYRNTGKNR